MGSAPSKEASLRGTVSASHRTKVGPLLRANHKHEIVLATGHTSRISQALAAACVLQIEPVSALFDLWDKLAIDTQDSQDSRDDEIVLEDYLSRETLGHAACATRYVDFFDDEVVRLLYDTTTCIKTYLAVPQVASGLLARQGWGARHLAYAVELESKDMCTEALGGALSFYEEDAMEAQDSRGSEDTVQEGQGQAAAAGATVVPRTEAEVLRARDTVIASTLRDKADTMDAVTHLVVLHAICVLWEYLPHSQFRRLWIHQTTKIHLLPMSSSSSSSPPPSAKTEAYDDGFWPAVMREACQRQPQYLPELRLLHDHPQYGHGVAQQLFR